MRDYFNDFEVSIKNDAYKYLGSTLSGDTATFRVWAPNADSVSVVGNFNAWDAARNTMHRISGGVWETEISGVKDFDIYKYAICKDGNTVLKSDPYARHFETAPANASKLYADKEQWNRMSLMNIANSGIFAADRSIADYANNIWNIKPVE